MKTEKGEQVVVIPSLLPETPTLPPLLSDSVLAEKRKSGQSVYKRIFQLKFIPVGFFSRLIVRAVHSSHCKITTKWRNGIELAEIVEGEEHVPGVGMIRYKEESVKTSKQIIFAVEILCVEEKGRSASLIHQLVGYVNYLIDTLSQASTEKVIHSVACPNCIGSSSEGSFNYRECVKEYLSGRTTLSCHICNTLLYLADLVPDVTLDHLPIVEGLLLGEELGSGGFGSVFKATMFEQGVSKTVAVKQLNFEQEKGEVKNVVESKFREFLHEVVIMSQLSHPNLVQFLGIVKKSPPQIVMEYCSRPDLLKHLNSEDLLPAELFTTNLKLRMLLDIAYGMEYLHSIPLIRLLLFFKLFLSFHFTSKKDLDLRCANVFVLSIDAMSSVVCKVGDFGLSQPITAKLGKSFHRNYRNLPYEYFHSSYNEKVDVYSFAMICYEVWERQACFSEYKEFLLAREGTPTLSKSSEDSSFLQSSDGVSSLKKSSGKFEVFFKDVNLKDAIEKHDLRPTLSDDCFIKLLVERCWRREPSERPSFVEVVENLKRGCTFVKLNDPLSFTPLSFTPIDFNWKRRRKEMEKILLEKQLLTEAASHLTCISVFKQILFLGCADGHVLCFDLLQKKTLFSTRLSAQRISHVSILDESNIFVSCEFLLQCSFKRDKLVPKNLSKQASLFLSLHVIPSNELLSLEPTTLSLWKAGFKGWKRTSVEVKEATCLQYTQFAPDEFKIFVGGADGKVSLYEHSREKPLVLLALLEVSDAPVRSLFLNEDCLWCADEGGEVVVNLYEENVIVSKFKAHEKATNIFAVSCTGHSHVWSSSEEKTVKLWDQNSFCQVKHFEMLNSPLTCLLQTFNDNVLVCDGTQVYEFVYKFEI